MPLLMSRLKPLCRETRPSFWTRSGISSEGPLEWGAPRPASPSLEIRGNATRGVLYWSCTILRKKDISKNQLVRKLIGIFMFNVKFNCFALRH